MISNDEASLIKSVQSVKIKNSSLEDIKGVLRFVMIKVGLRSQNWPDEIEKGVLISHILTNYSNHTCEEIKLAFDMAIAGKLELGKGESANCYENFSCLYFSSIMEAYKKWAEESVRYLNNIKTEVSQKIYTDEEILNERRGEIETAFQAMKKGYYPLLHTYFKEVLLTDELIGQEETLGEFFVRKLNAQTENIYKKG